MKNYYEILEVSENASSEVIEKAYKTLAKKYHPDTWPKDKIFYAESKFKEITEAYEVLSNDFSRRKYDEELGINNSLDEKYNTLYSEHEKLKQEVNNLRINNESEKYVNSNPDVNRYVKPNFSYAKSYYTSIKSAIQNESQKPQDERARDFKALILTIIIITVLIIVCWNVPFIKNFLFP